MIEFFGTLIALALCGFALGIGTLLHGAPLRPGCGGPGTARCEACPHRERPRVCERSRQGAEPTA